MKTAAERLLLFSPLTLDPLRFDTALAQARTIYVSFTDSYTFNDQSLSSLLSVLPLAFHTPLRNTTITSMLSVSIDKGYI